MAAAIRRDQFSTKHTTVWARWLLGKTLVRRHPDESVSRHAIVETEAYHGEQDLACHASKGRTLRTDILYGEAGIWYVYLCYGVHEMLNLVAGPKDFPAAILIRGLHDVTGPGRLTKRLNIDRALNRQPAEPSSGLWMEDDGVVVPPRAVKTTPRIGIDYAGPVWAAKRWRFVVDPGALRRSASVSAETTASTEISPRSVLRRRT